MTREKLEAGSMTGARLGSALLFLLCTACAHYPMNPAYSGPRELPPETAGHYTYQKRALFYAEAVLREEKRYSIRRIQIPAARPSEAVTRPFPSQEAIAIDHYRVRGEQKTPVIVVLPILGGNNREIRIFCEYFADHGYAAVIVHRDQQEKDNLRLETLERSLRQIVLDHRLALDWIQTQEHLDAERIGVFGISMGGIKAALITALDPRVRAAVIALAGGDLPYILMNSSEPAVGRKVEAMMRERRSSREELYRMLKAEIRTDPLTFSAYIDASRVQMILGIFDTVIPYRKGRELAAAIGGPEMILLPTGHYSSLLYIYYVRGTSLEFFARMFGTTKSSRAPRWPSARETVARTGGRQPCPR